MLWTGEEHLAQGQGVHSAHPPAPLNLPPPGCIQKGLPRPQQRWQLQAGVFGCPGASLLPCTTLLPGPGTSLMPSAPRAGLDVTSTCRECCQPVGFLQGTSIPVSHLNCRALGRGPCCCPTAIMGPESCDQLCHCSKKRRGTSAPCSVKEQQPFSTGTFCTASIKTTTPTKSSVFWK